MQEITELVSKMKSKFYANLFSKDSNYNSALLTKRKYDSIIEDVKRIKVSKKKESSRDYRIIERYDVLTAEGCEKLIEPLSYARESVKEFVHAEELFDILYSTHLSIGHGGRDKMIKQLNILYKNITQAQIKLFLELCEPCQQKQKIKGSNDHSSLSGHSHEHGHTHEHMSSPGAFLSRDLPISRKDFQKRAFTVGIGGPVGSGKTALVLALSQWMREKYNLCIVTNDIFTREDWEFLVKNKALPEERIKAVETGGCPHAAIREDYSLNLEVVKDLTRVFSPEIVLLESGGDNLAANFSRDLADYIIYVIDVAGGDKIPRKGGPGITESDLLVINKTDLAIAVGASLEVMLQDANVMRQNGPTVFIQAKHMKGVEDVANHILKAYKSTCSDK